MRRDLAGKLVSIPPPLLPSQRVYIGNSLMPSFFPPLLLTASTRALFILPSLLGLGLVGGRIKSLVPTLIKATMQQMIVFVIMTGYAWVP